MDERLKTVMHLMMLGLDDAVSNIDDKSRNADFLKARAFTSTTILRWILYPCGSHNWESFKEYVNNLIRINEINQDKISKYHDFFEFTVWHLEELKNNTAIIEGIHADV